MSSAQPQAGPSGAMPGPSGADAGRSRGQASPADKETKFTMKTQKSTGPSAKRLQRELAEITLDPPPNCRKMPRSLSNAEKQRQYRLRRDADPAKRETYLSQKKKKYRNDISKGNRKSIKDLSDRDKRNQRKQWRENQKNCRDARRKEPLTPPASPEVEYGHAPDSQTRRGRNKVRRDRSKCYRKNKRLEVALQAERRAADRYKKRYLRLLKKFDKGTPSPKTRTKKLLRHWNSGTREQVARTLTFHYSVLSDFREKYKRSKSLYVRQIARKFICGKIIKKYKLMRMAQSLLPIGNRGLCTDNHVEPMRKVSVNPVSAKCKAFFCRDDVSRMTTGKKNTITRNNVKMQRRLLSDTLQNLHRKFISESLDISYSFFCKLRPFYVVEPNELDRQTCQCKVHENLQFMANTLNKMQLIPSNNLEDLVKNIVCSVKSKECAYDECHECNGKKYSFTDPVGDESVTYMQWILKKVPRKDTSEESTSDCINITTKVEVSSTLPELIESFQRGLLQFKKHIFNIRRQHIVYKEVRENLTASDCLIHVDFSENYSCKYSEEIHAAHFGGSHNQASLHTGVLYIKDKTISFCSISPSRRHDPPAIWAHMDPVLQMIRESYPQISTVHFFSDGPVTQYKQKGNFLFLTTLPFKYGFRATSWHFFEASHGKGAPDGVGGYLKRTADRLVRLGKDIQNAQVLWVELSAQNTSVKLFFIDNNNVDTKNAEMLRYGPLPIIKGTRKMHQIVCLSPGTLICRDVSCVCKIKQGVLDCDCYEPRRFVMDLSQCNQNLEQTVHGTPQPTPDLSNISTPKSISNYQVGQYCVVLYDEKPYPGLIVGTGNDEIQVKCMASLGRNRFVWPAPRDDVNWYGLDEVVSLVPEPEEHGTRRKYLSIHKETWEVIEKKCS